MSREGPRYLAIADALADDVNSGRLRPGARLPTHRDLADRLRVTIGTVTRAYAEAARRGHISGEVGRGTFVRASATEAPELPPAEPGLIDLSINHPAPLPAEARSPIAATLKGLATRSDLEELLGYPPAGGAPEHRDAGVRWLGRCGLAATRDEVIVSSGSQHGMTAVFTALVRPGDTVATEALTYPGMRALASLLRLRLCGLPIDGSGLRPDALEAACRTGGTKAVYIVPNLHNPTTAIMPEARRREIARIAEAHRILIVEDDVHGPMLPSPPRPIATFAPDRTVYVSGTAKSLAPGLRVGFIRAPRSLVARLAAAVRATTWMAPPLMAEIAATWIRDGTAESVIERRRKEAQARHRLATEVLAGFDFAAHPAAFHLWLRLPEGWRSDAFGDACRRSGVAVTPASAFAVGRDVPEAVRLGLGGPRDRAELRRGLEAVRETLGRTVDGNYSYAPVGP